MTIATPKKTTKKTVKKKATKKNLGGRPKKVWTAKEIKQFEKLCELHCTQEEICGVMDVNSDTLDKLLKDHYGKGFSEIFPLKSSGGKMSLRRKQYSIAMKGNVSMLQWLGQNWLGQSSRREVKGDIKNEFSYDSLFEYINGEEK